MTVGLSATIRFPDRSVERLVLVDEPVEGASIDARGERWRITRIRLPWGLDAPGDVVYEFDVEAAPARPPSNGF